MTRTPHRPLPGIDLRYDSIFIMPKVLTSSIDYAKTKTTFSFILSIASVISLLILTFGVFSIFFQSRGNFDMFAVLLKASSDNLTGIFGLGFMFVASTLVYHALWSFHYRKIRTTLQRAFFWFVYVLCTGYFSYAVFPLVVSVATLFAWICWTTIYAVHKASKVYLQKRERRYTRSAQSGFKIYVSFLGFCILSFLIIDPLPVLPEEMVIVTRNNIASNAYLGQMHYVGGQGISPATLERVVVTKESPKTIELVDLETRNAYIFPLDAVTCRAFLNTTSAKYENGKRSFEYHHTFWNPLSQIIEDSIRVSNYSILSVNDPGQVELEPCIR